jgi:hypothetical protein
MKNYTITTTTNGEVNALREKTRAALEARKDRSAWDRGVTLYAFDLLDHMEDSADYWNDCETAEEFFLNGARDWEQYSRGGCSLYHDVHIARRLCTPSELKKTDNGNRRPNCREEWLDVQARALYQAFERVVDALRA